MAKTFTDAEGVWKMQLENRILIDASGQRDEFLATAVIKRIEKVIKEHFIEGSGDACYLLSRINKAIEAFENAGCCLDAWEYCESEEAIEECLGIELAKVSDHQCSQQQQLAKSQFPKE